jgi:hypothetical protein
MGIDIVQAGAVCAALVAMAALLAGLWRLVVKIKRAADYLEALHDLASYQLNPNSGGSLVDKVTALGEWTLAHDAKHDDDKDELWSVLSSHGIDRRKAPD